MSFSASLDWFVLWPVRIAVCCYIVRTLFDVASLNGPDHRTGTDARRLGWLRVVRLVWTAGLVLYGIHVVGAYGVVYGWSHQVAVAETALRIPEFGGISWGEIGLAMNHLFTLAWTIDVVRWWRAGPAFPDEHAGHVAVLHVFMGFMVFNATVVFGPQGWRMVVFLFLLAAAGLVLFGPRSTNDADTE